MRFPKGGKIPALYRTPFLHVSDHEVKTACFKLPCHPELVEGSDCDSVKTPIAMKTCRFCKHTYPKLVRAHIIPRAFFKILRGSGKFSIVVEAGPKHLTQEFKQAGISDEDILCENCERRFSPLDTHGVHVFTEVLKLKTLY